MQPAEPAQPPLPPQRPWNTPPAPTAPPPAATQASMSTGSLPTGLTESIDIRVSKRLLWIGGAAYPLHNIARVYTYTLNPRRKEAVLRFFRRVGITLAVTAALTLLGGTIAALAQGEETPATLLGLMWLASGAFMIYALVDMIAVLTAQPHFVLGVETAGASTAVVSGRDHGQLRQLVHLISDAIENPQAEFQVRVERLVISSPSNYYFGDNVNMYGGSNNVGMANS
ncbi:Hypothetical protein SCLAV_p0744 (plasmid) [Streptomyces clavuligerus]|uniref:Uncharacterized protein n=5 Tax=Streptomyces clavuligerus TaxID=1901 RepID=D5SJY8_STRCL|nr:Hypothetical protein SCLAV_p0744 [Streptomyces clavuligerus]